MMRITGREGERENMVLGGKKKTLFFSFFLLLALASG